MTIQALVFGFDGTIMDTLSPSVSVMADLYHAYGIEAAEERWASAYGTSPEDWPDPCTELATLVEQDIDCKKFYAELKTRERVLLERESALPGVVDYLETAPSLGLKLGLASSSDVIWVSRYLDQLGLRHHFDVIKTVDDVAKGKPDPALFEATLAALGVAPNQAIAIEDSPQGIAAAKGAGLFTLVVPNKVTSNLDLSSADMRLDSLADVPLAALLEKVAAMRTA